MGQKTAVFYMLRVKCNVQYVQYYVYISHILQLIGGGGGVCGLCEKKNQVRAKVSSIKSVSVHPSQASTDKEAIGRHCTSSPLEKVSVDE
jgi:hypothetical protein